MQKRRRLTTSQTSKMASTSKLFFGCCLPLFRLHSSSCCLWRSPFKSHQQCYWDHGNASLHFCLRNDLCSTFRPTLDHHWKHGPGAGVHGRALPHLRGAGPALPARVRLDGPLERGLPGPGRRLLPLQHRGRLHAVHGRGVQPAHLGHLRGGGRAGRAAGADGPPGAPGPRAGHAGARHHHVPDGGQAQGHQGDAVPGPAPAAGAGGLCALAGHRRRRAGRHPAQGAQRGRGAGAHAARAGRVRHHLGAPLGRGPAQPAPGRALGLRAARGHGRRAALHGPDHHGAPGERHPHAGEGLRPAPGHGGAGGAHGGLLGLRAALAGGGHGALGGARQRADHHGRGHGPAREGGRAARVWVCDPRAHPRGHPCGPRPAGPDSAGGAQRSVPVPGHLLAAGQPAVRAPQAGDGGGPAQEAAHGAVLRGPAPPHRPQVHLAADGLPGGPVAAEGQPGGRALPRDDCAAAAHPARHRARGLLHQGGAGRARCLRTNRKVVEYEHLDH
ncbi:unnamed protein product [Heterosigma akashiwo]